MKPTMVDPDYRRAEFSFQMEFPVYFLEELESYSMKLPDSVVLEMYDDSEKQWRVEITRFKRRGSKYKEEVKFQRASGWQEFVLENDVRVGDFLVFQTTAASRFSRGASLITPRPPGNGVPSSKYDVVV